MMFGLGKFGMRRTQADMSFILTFGRAHGVCHAINYILHPHPPNINTDKGPIVTIVSLPL